MTTFDDADAVWRRYPALPRMWTDTRVAAVILELERERDETRAQLNHAAGVIKDMEAKMLPVNEYVARLEAACMEALAIAEGRQPGTWDDVMRLLRAVLPEILRAQGQ